MSQKNRKTPAGGTIPARVSTSRTDAEINRQAVSTALLQQRQATARKNMRRALACADDLTPEDRAALLGALAVVEQLPETLLAPCEVAFEAGLAESTVRDLCRDGRFGRKVGGRWRLTADEGRRIAAGAR